MKKRNKIISLFFVLWLCSCSVADKNIHIEGINKPSYENCVGKIAAIQEVCFYEEPNAESEIVTIGEVGEIFEYEKKYNDEQTWCCVSYGDKKLWCMLSDESVVEISSEENKVSEEIEDNKVYIDNIVCESLVESNNIDGLIRYFEQIGLKAQTKEKSVTVSAYDKSVIAIDMIDVSCFDYVGEYNKGDTIEIPVIHNVLDEDTIAWDFKLDDSKNPIGMEICISFDDVVYIDNIIHGRTNEDEVHNNPGYNIMFFGKHDKDVFDIEQYANTHEVLYLIATQHSDLLGLTQSQFIGMWGRNPTYIRSQSEKIADINDGDILVVDWSADGSTVRTCPYIADSCELKYGDINACDKNADTCDISKIPWDGELYKIAWSNGISSRDCFEFFTNCEYYTRAKYRLDNKNN